MFKDNISEFIKYLGNKEYKNLASQIAKHMGISFDENFMPPDSVLNSVKKIVDLLFSENKDKEQDISLFVDQLPHNSEDLSYGLKEYLWSLNKRIIRLKEMVSKGGNFLNKAIVFLCSLPFISIFYVFLFGNEWSTKILNNYLIALFYNRMTYANAIVGAFFLLIVFLIFKCIDFFSKKYLKNITFLICEIYLIRIIICLLCVLLILFVFNDLFFSESTATKLRDSETFLKGYVSAQELEKIKTTNDSIIKNLSQGNPDFIWTVLSGLLCLASLFIVEIVNGWKFNLKKIKFTKGATKNVNLQDDNEFLWKLSVFLGEEGITEKTKEIAGMFNSIIKLPENIAKEKIISEVDRLAKCSETYKYDFLLLLLNIVTKNSSKATSGFEDTKYSEIKKSKKPFSECLLSFYKGEYGLAFSFWLVLLPYFVISNYLYTKFTTQIVYHMLMKDLWFICMEIFDIVLRAYMYVSVWNAASKYKKNVLYRYLAKGCILLLIIMFVIYNYYALLFVFP